MKCLQHAGLLEPPLVLGRSDGPVLAQAGPVLGGSEGSVLAQAGPVLGRDGLSHGAPCVALARAVSEAIQNESMLRGATTSSLPGCPPSPRGWSDARFMPIGRCLLGLGPVLWL